MLKRRDIWKLSEEDPWHPVIEWYARAIAELRSRDGTDLADPACWGYLAAIHGTDIPRNRWPQGATWSQCQHSSWFFLPWHRMYLHYFERTVREAVARLGGPDDWALPYWDYSDPGRPDTRMLPPAFRERHMPSGEPNPLFTEERAPGINDGGKLLPGSVLLGDAMDERVFADPTGGRPGFGGGVTGWNDAGGRVGSLENVPHGNVHMDVGGDSPRRWMSRFETAGLEPAFWLHHANLDRLWESWLALGDGRKNPESGKWLGMRFTLGSGAAALTLAVRDVLDTRAVPLGYAYESLAIAGVEPGAKPGLKINTFDVLDVLVPDDVPAEMVGATEKRVPLGAGASDAVLFVSAPSGPASTGTRPTKSRNAIRLDDAEDAEDGVDADSLEPQPRRVYLKVENVEGSELAASSYAVHVNLPSGADAAAHPERRAGQISMFGVAEASRGDENHGGGGLTFSFDITDVARRLREEGDWDPDRLRVTFTPLRRDREGGEKRRDGGDVSAGRVSLFYA